MKNNLSKISGDAVLRQMKTKNIFDKEEFVDMFWCVITEFDRRNIYIVECVVAKIMDKIMVDYGCRWNSDSVKSEIARRYSIKED